MKAFTLLNVGYFVALIQFCHASQNLQCVSDFVHNVTCVWNRIFGTHKMCTLYGAPVDRKIRATAQCELKTFDDSNPTLQKCSVGFDTVSIGQLTEFNFEVKCGNDNEPVVQLSEFKPVEHIKMHPPSRLEVAQANISWDLGSPHSPFIVKYDFQLQYRQADQRWEDVKSIDVCDEMTRVELNQEKLALGAQYFARVRIRCSQFDNCLWSDWSPITNWTSTVGRTSTFPDLILGLCTTLPGLAIVIVVFLILFKCGWVQKLKHSYIPDPSKYFDELYSYHKGNFKSWLGPSTVIEVLTPSEAEDISQVKVQNLQNSSSVLLKVFVSGSQQPQDDSSPHSPKFSNSDHLLSQTSVSPCEALEPCSPVSPYRPVRIESDGNCEMADAGGNSIDRDDCDRLQVTSSSEEMDKLHRKTRSLDSGFAGGSEDQDSHEVSDLDDESLQSPSSPLETDNVPSNATVPCSSIWPPLLGLCGVPFRFPEFLGNLEGKPLEGVTSGMLDTSTDDYRPLKEVESTG